MLYFSVVKKSKVSFSDFQKLDLRIGKVLEARKVAESKNLVRMKVDLGGDYGIVRVFAGLLRFVDPKQLEGKKFIFVANLEAKKFINEQGEAMILVAQKSEGYDLISVEDKLEEGSIVL